MKKSAKQGIDGANFELVLNGIGRDQYIKHQPLINQHGKEFGSVETKDGKALIQLNFPKFVRQNNVEPFSLTDMIRLEILKCNLEEQLQRLFGNISENRLTSIECNITQLVCGEQTCEQVNHVLRLLNACTLSKRADKQNKLFVNSAKDNRYQMNVSGVVTHSVKGRYVLKAYNKYFQIWKDCEMHNEISEDLLRIEIVMQKRTLKKLFNDKLSINHILQRKSLIAIMNEYKRIYSEELITEYVKPCLSQCTEILFESMTQTASPYFISETIAKHKDIIFDVEILRKALKRYYSFKKMPDNSRSNIYKYAKNYRIPKDVIVTLKEFRNSCG